MKVREALQLASHVAVKSGTLPILSHLRIAGGRISATDMMQQIDIPLDIDEFSAADGASLAAAAFCIHGARLVRILKTLPDNANLQMSVRDNRFFLRAGDTEFELNTLPSSDFPDLEQSKDPTTQFTVDSTKLVAALNFVAPAVAIKDVRYYLCGAHMAIAQGKLVLSGTDGHRLHQIRVEIEDADVEPVAGIIPSAGIARIIDIAGRHSSVELSLNARQLTLTDRESLSIKLIEGVYPNVERVIPRHQGVTGSAPRKAFAEAAERVAQVLIGEKIEAITIAFDVAAIRLRAQNINGERAATQIAWAQVEPTMKPIEIAFPWYQIVDAMKAFDGDNVFVHLPEAATSSLYLTDDNDGHRDVVVMPVRA